MVLFWMIMATLFVMVLSSCATVPTNMQDRCVALGGEVTDFGCLFRPPITFELGIPVSGNPTWDCRQVGGVEDRFGQCSRTIMEE